MHTTTAVIGPSRKVQLSYRARIVVTTAASIAGLVLIEATATDYALLGALIAVAGFWTCLLPRNPATPELFTPGNYHLFLFFATMVVGATLMPVDPLTGRFWSYAPAVEVARTLTPWVSAIWVTGFAAYLAGYFVVQRPSRRLSPRAGGEGADTWMWITGTVLVAAGVGGLVIAAGSLRNALMLGGTRAGAEMLGEGSFRYTVWMEATPIGAALLWYFIWARFKLRPVSGAFLVILLYAPLVPMYVYSSGRARAIIPLIFLVALYHRYCYRFSTRWLVLVFVAGIPVLSLWAQYRRQTSDLELTPEGMLQVVTADFGRYDVSAVAIAGASTGGIQPLWGETIVAAVRRAWLVPRSGGEPLMGGTEAMARAMSGDPQFRGASTYAAPLLVEGYLNFDVAGVVVFLFVLGLLVARLDIFAMNGGLLEYLFALAAAIKLPFGVSTEISVTRLIWVVLLPYLVAWTLRTYMRPRDYRARNRVVARSTAL